MELSVCKFTVCLSICVQNISETRELIFTKLKTYQVPLQLLVFKESKSKIKFTGHATGRTSGSAAGAGSQGTLAVHSATVTVARVMGRMPRMRTSSQCCDSMTNGI